MGTSGELREERAKERANMQAKMAACQRRARFMACLANTKVQWDELLDEEKANILGEQVVIRDAEGKTSHFSAAELLDGLKSLGIDVPWADGENRLEKPRKKDAAEDENDDEEMLKLADEADLSGSIQEEVIETDLEELEKIAEATAAVFEETDVALKDASARLEALLKQEEHQDEPSVWPKWLGVAAGVACAGLAVNWMRK